MAAMLTIVDPGDKVIVFSPFYENYGADAILSGAEPIYVNLSPPDFSFDVNELEEAFKSGAKALILCNPSNPTGKVFTQAELDNKFFFIYLFIVFFCQIIASFFHSSITIMHLFLFCSFPFPPFFLP